MSLLMMTGNVINVLVTPTGTNREGREYGGDHQIQLMGESVLANGEKRMELITLRTETPEKFRDTVGKNVMFPVGCFVRNNAIIYYIEKGAAPKVLGNQAQVAS